MTSLGNPPQVRALTKGPKHHFFGFHDLCPWDESEKYVLSMEVDFLDRPVSKDDEASIGIVHLDEENRFEILAKTKAWNFQQGSRQQWLPGESDRIIFNDRDGDGFISVILDISSGKRREIPAPVYAVDPGGAFGLGVNFSRLHNLLGYGYPGGTDPCKVENAPVNDGIYRINLENGRTDLIISIAEVAQLGLDSSATRTHPHFLSHINYNPAGSRICFVHKYWLEDGGASIRLITANPDGTDLHPLPGEVTHFCWKGEQHIVKWGRNRAAINRIRKMKMMALPVFARALKFIREMGPQLRQKYLGDRYFLLADKSQEVSDIGVGTLTSDGHPSFSPDGKWMITDTYADKSHYRTLILYHWDSKHRIDLGRFYSLPDQSSQVDENWDISEMRTDLHPRWNRSGTQVCIDSIHEGSKQIYILDVSAITGS